MPEHVHLLVDEPDAGTPSTVLHKLKLRVSKKMRWPSATGETLRAFWQAQVYHFTVYSEISFAAWRVAVEQLVFLQR